MVGFIFGGNTGETPESLKRKRELIERMMLGERTPQNWGEGWGAVLKGIGSRIEQNRLDKAEAEGRQAGDATFDKIKSWLTGESIPSTSYPSGNIPMSEGGNQVAATTPGATPDMTGNEVYSGFMDTVKTGVQNPYALAAIAATGNAESKFSPGNVKRTWSDPSESGQAGTAGGIMSWRGPRYQALAATGDLSPQGQAKFFLQENPQLIEQLNNAQSVEEAQSLMNNAWKFAGYNRAGGEAERRLKSARRYLPTFQGGEKETASISPEAAFDAILTTNPDIPFNADPIMQRNMAQPSLSDEVAAYEQTPEYRQRFPGLQQQGQQFDAGRFGGENLAQMPVMGRQGLGSALQASNQAGMGQQAISNQMGGVPQEFQGSQQLMNAQGGMMPTLMGGLPANAQQMAQAQQAGQQQIQDVSQPSLAQLVEWASHPFLTQEQRSMANMLIEQEMQKRQSAREEQQWRARQDYEQQLRQQDPAYQLEQDYRRAQIDALGRKADGLDDAAKVQSSVVLDDGTSVLVMNNGQRRVVSASGEELSGQMAADAIRAARDYGVENQRAIYGSRRAGTLGSDIEFGSDAEAAKAGGKNLAEFRAALPNVEASGGELLSSIDSLANDPYLDSMVGSVQGRWLPNVTSDAARVQSKMDQIGGQSFLQAFNMLRGAGQITEQEGRKATEAMARLNTAQSEEDYRQALAELRGVVERGIESARRKAGGGAAQSGGVDYRDRYGLE
jgi:hypothetical protein